MAFAYCILYFVVEPHSSYKPSPGVCVLNEQAVPFLSGAAKKLQAVSETRDPLTSQTLPHHRDHHHSHSHTTLPLPPLLPRLPPPHLGRLMRS